MKLLRAFLKRTISVRYFFMSIITALLSIAIIVGIYTAGFNNLVITVLVAVNALVLIVLAFVFAGKTNKLLNRPIDAIIKAVEALAEGDVDIVLSDGVPGDLGKLISSLHTLSENIRQQAHVADRIAAGDLTVMVPIRSKHDILGKKLYIQEEQ